MDNIFNSFSTRELAIAFWISIGLIACMFGKSIRQSIFRFIKSFFAWKISVLLLVFFTYTAFCVLIFYKLNFWNITLLKDTIIWTFGFGIVSLINISKANDTGYFKSMFFDAVKWTIAIVFIINFFTFSLATELIIIPIIVFSVMLQDVASSDSKYKKVENLIKNIFVCFSIFVFLFSLYRTIEKYSELFTIDNLKSLLLPVFLTITFLPFMYLFNLVSKYEDLWVRLRFVIRNDNDRKRVKWQIFLIANFNINKLMSISKNIAMPVNVYNDTSKEMIKQISKGQYFEKK